MTKESLIVFQIIKESVFTEAKHDSALFSGVDWIFVYQEMQQQSLTALPYNWLKEHPLPEKGLYDAWLKNCTFQQGSWIRIMHGQQQLLDLLEEEGIKCVILKGASAAFFYPYPFLRSMGDVDFLVRKEDLERTADLLEKNQYQLINDKNLEEHHFSYSKDGVLFELHWRLGIDKNEAWNPLLEEGINNREIRLIGNYSFPSLPVRLNGLSLLFHIDQHLRSGLGLRQILDWMMFLDKNNCFEEMRPLLQQAGLERLAETVTSMCQKYLGLRPIVQDYDQLPVDEFMEYILQNGNFGRKEGFEGKTSFVYADMKGPGRLFSRLQKGGLKNWKTARENTFLRPFAWIYQIGHIGKELVAHRMSASEYMKVRNEGIRKRKLYRKLGLRIDRNIS